MRVVRVISLLVLALGVATGTPAAASRTDDVKARIARLDPKYRDWLGEVALLIGKDELAQFLALDKDYQRDGFVRRFWEARNPYPGSSRNAFQAQWEARVEAARTRYGNLTEDRAKMLLLHGEPQGVYKTDCGMALWPLQIWSYVAGDRLPRDTVLLFYQRAGGGPFKLWHRIDGTAVLVARITPQLEQFDSVTNFEQWAWNNCVKQEAGTLIYAIGAAFREDESGLLDHIFVPPPPRDVEWLGSFRGLSTDLPAGAAPLAAKVELQFPARDRGRTVMQGLVQVPVAAAAPADLEGHRSYNFLLTGEVLHESELVESFRYRFDLPSAGLAGDTLPLAFERALRPGDYVLVLRVEDLHSHRNFRDERPIAVPSAESLPEIGTTREPPEVTAALEAARAELRAAGAAAPGASGGGAGPGGAAPGGTGPGLTGPGGTGPGGTGPGLTGPGGTGPGGTGPGGTGGPGVAGANVHLVPPPAAEQTGAVRVEAQASGQGIHKVTFYLDGKEMLSRVRPPYSVELNLGPVPVSRELRAAAFDAGGRELASDTLTLNPPKQRFAVRLVEPRSGGSYRGRVLARAEVQVPDGASLERLELFLDDQRVATLYQAPWTQLIPLPSPAAAAGRGTAAAGSFVRAVAYLGDGTSTEDLAVINSADVVEKLDVRLVELYAAVFDRGGRPVGGLGEGDFKVLDGGEAQSVLRFERVRDLPLHLLFAIDTSASMAATLPQVQKAALAFLRRTLTPKDRAALLTFSDSPVLRTPFTSDLGTLAGALAGLNAERGTALFDSLVYGLSYMKGVQHGQSAVILFTDGGDHLSRLSFDETLAFARRAGIAIYAIGAHIPRLDLQIRGHLAKLAEETGGRSFFIESAAELDGVYASIEDELRSRYLLAYQPKAAPRAGEFRAVEVRVAGDGMRVKTIRGYYP